MRFTIAQTIQHLITVLGCIVVFFISNQAQANCGCQVGANGIKIIGFELIAKSCPTEPFSDTKNFTYIMNPIDCTGSNVYAYSSYGDISGTVESLSSYFISNGYRVLRNPSGSHLFAVQKGNYPYTGNVAGVNMYGLDAGIYYADPTESINEYCTDHPLGDSDSDGYPDCLDCAINDPNSNDVCEIDQCPDDPLKTEPGACGCNEAETDSNNNGEPDCVDDQNAGSPDKCETN